MKTTTNDYSISERGEIIWTETDAARAIDKARELAADIQTQWIGIEDATAADVADHLSANECTLSPDMLELVEREVGRIL